MGLFSGKKKKEDEDQDSIVGYPPPQNSAPAPTGPSGGYIPPAPPGRGPIPPGGLLPQAPPPGAAPRAMGSIPPTEPIRSNPTASKPLLPPEDPAPRPKLSVEDVFPDSGEPKSDDARKPERPSGAAAGLSPHRPTATLEVSKESKALEKLLLEAVEQGASDLHLSRGVPPTIRLDGSLVPLDYPKLSRSDCQRLVYSVLTEQQREKFEREWELDLSVDLSEAGRFRVNVHRQRGGVEAAFRVVNDVILPLRRLGLPSVVEEIGRKHMGLVLVTGPTGSGKTTTLASIVDQINSERQSMIITVEDPIEYIHKNKRSIVKQRELLSDTLSFSKALRHVLRQDPDVIVVGEMRDLETISTALTAAETGHLVFATLHTPDASQTIDRIIDVFPPHQQEQTRIQVANTLQAIIAQQLLPVPGNRGRVVAVEILIATIAVRKIIRTGKTEQLYTMMQTNWEAGMITMDKSLKTLYQQGLISFDDAISRCKFPAEFDNI